MDWPLLNLLQSQQRQKMDELVAPLAREYDNAHVTKVFQDISPAKGLSELSRRPSWWSSAVTAAAGSPTRFWISQPERDPPRRMPGAGGAVAHSRKTSTATANSGAKGIEPRPTRCERSNLGIGCPGTDGHARKRLINELTMLAVQISEALLRTGFRLAVNRRPGQQKL